MWMRRGLVGLVYAPVLLAACGSSTPVGALLPPNTPVASATLEVPQNSVGVVLVASPTGSITVTSGPATTGTPPTSAPATNTPVTISLTGTGAAPGISPTHTRTPGRGTVTATRQPTASPTKTPRPSDDKGFAPSEAPTASAIVLESLTTPIKKGADASLIIQTAPNAGCFLTYVEPSGVVSTAEGLGKKIADGTGTADGTGRSARRQARAPAG
jgi:hypothetical protein